MNCKYRAVIFDFDGTIINSVFSGMHDFIKMCHKLRIKNVPSFDFLKKHWGLKYQEIIEKVQVHYHWTNEEKEEFEECSFNEEKPPEIFSGVLNYIFKLRESSIECLIISSRRKESLVKAMEAVKLNREDFFLVQGVEDCEFSKPDKRVFDTAFSLLKHEEIFKEESCYIGDTEFDFLAARDAGISFFAVKTGIFTKDDWIRIGVPLENIFENVIDVLYYILEN